MKTNMAWGYTTRTGVREYLIQEHREKNRIKTKIDNTDKIA